TSSSTTSSCTVPRKPAGNGWPSTRPAAWTRRSSRSSPRREPAPRVSPNWCASSAGPHDRVGRAPPSERDDPAQDPPGLDVGVPLVDLIEPVRLGDHFIELQDTVAVEAQQPGNLDPGAFRSVQ